MLALLGLGKEPIRYANIYFKVEGTFFLEDRVPEVPADDPVVEVYDKRVGQVEALDALSEIVLFLLAGLPRIIRCRLELVEPAFFG